MEKLATRTVVEGVATQAGGPGGGGGFGAVAAAIARLPEAERAPVQAALGKIPTHMNAEMTILLRQKKTALEIRDFLTGEFEPLPIEDLMAYLRAQEKIGRVKLSEKPEEAKPVAPAKRGKAAKKSA